MKRKYVLHRMLLCFLLTVCLLLLPACRIQSPDESTGQSAAHGENHTVNTNETTDQNVGQDENNTANSNTINLESLTWRTSIVRTPGRSGFPTSAAVRVSYESWQKTLSFNLDAHKLCYQYEYCTMGGGVPCNAMDYFQKTNYSEAYFQENTLVLIDLRLDKNNPYSVKGVRYEDGVLTCDIEIERPIRRKTNSYWSVYVEVESALPSDTEFVLNITSRTDGQQKDTDLINSWEPSFLRLQGWALWEKDSPQIAKVLTYESCKELLEECLSRHGACGKDCYQYSEETGMCLYAQKVKSISYPETFFVDKSLVVVGLSSGSGSTQFEVYDLHYTADTLTCVIDGLYCTEPMAGTADMASWLCFIEVDTVLPEDTNIVLDTGMVEYDLETYTQKSEEYRNYCI